MPSFSIPLSGLLANEEALSIISNNLANLNTVAYKSVKPQFSDLFFQQLGTNGAGDPIQLGLGTQITSTTTQFTQGNIQNTGVSTDVAVQGDGFLQAQKGGVTFYTRNGNLSVDSQGYLVTQDGGSVVGFPAVNGVVNPSSTLVPLLIKGGQSSPPAATQNVQIAMNLDATAAVAPVNLGLNLFAGANPGDQFSTSVQVFDSSGTQHTLTYTFTNKVADTWDMSISIPGADVGQGSPVTIYDSTFPGYVPLTFPSGGGKITSPVAPVAITLPSGTSLADHATLAFNWDPSGTTESSSTSAATPPPSTPQFSTVVQVFDSLGSSHVLTYSFSKVASNTWSYQITMPAADVGSMGSPVLLNSGTLAFNPDGTLKSPSSDVTSITAKGLADGAKDLSFTWDLFSANKTATITQVAGTSSASSTQQDGFPSGSLVSFSIGSDGTIQGAFNNGKTLAIGQIVLATFPNSQGLLRVGENNFMTTLASGLPTVGVPGSGGRGTLAGGGLESSNVDIATEFAQLILAQRGYEANARAFTATDQVTQDTINLGR